MRAQTGISYALREASAQGHFGPPYAELVPPGGETSRHSLLLDLSGRLGLSNLLPGTAVFKPSKTSKKRDVAEFFGAAGGLVQQP